MKDHVAIIIRNNERKILFIQRSLTKKTVPGMWAFPSGTIEKGESVTKTALRESLEELNMNISPSKILAELELPEFDVKLHFIECFSNGESPKIQQPEEIEKFEWMTFSEFFDRFSDNKIGHGLVCLRSNQDVLGDLK